MQYFGEKYTFNIKHITFRQQQVVLKWLIQTSKWNISVQGNPGLKVWFMGHSCRDEVWLFGIDYGKHRLILSNKEGIG